MLSTEEMCRAQRLKLYYGLLMGRHEKHFWSRFGEVLCDDLSNGYEKRLINMEDNNQTLVKTMFIQESQFSGLIEQ